MAAYSIFKTPLTFKLKLDYFIVGMWTFIKLTIENDFHIPVGFVFYITKAEILKKIT